MPQPKAESSYTSPVRSNVKGLESVLTEIRKRRSKAIGDGMAVTKVGFTADHAVPVHERLDVHHPIGQAKYLEQPLRTEEKPMADIVKKRLMARETLKSAQVSAAQHLIKVALPLVPVDTGELRSSWFII